VMTPLIKRLSNIDSQNVVTRGVSLAGNFFIWSYGVSGRKLAHMARLKTADHLGHV
jgi:hypothetical protein